MAKPPIIYTSSVTPIKVIMGVQELFVNISKFKAMAKTARPLTRAQLWFIWKAINELKHYLGNQIEAGAEGADKDYNNAVKAQELIIKERTRLYNIKK